MFVLSNIDRLYDGTSPEPSSLHRAVDLHIDAGRVVARRPHDPQLELGEDHRIVDCSGRVVTPGLVDCHGHITFLGMTDRGMERMNASEAMIYVEKALYRSLVDGGVTTMRDIGGATDKMKRLVEEGVMIGPRLKIAICMLSTTGGHADMRGPDRCHAQINRIWPAIEGRPSNIVDGPWNCRQRIREIAACGADLIKVCASPGVASPSDRLEHREFTAEELEALCDEAAGRGLRVAAHAHSQSGIEMGIRHGVHDLQHISFMDERLVELAYEKGCTVTPTSWVTHRLLEHRADFSPLIQEKIQQVAEVHQRAVEYAASGGLHILAGTDPVFPDMHGRNYMELVSLVRDGLKPLAAWWGATGLAAREIGQDDAGTLEEGQRADVLVCRHDVLEDPERFTADTIVEVFQDGMAHRGAFEGLPVRRFSDTVTAVLGEPPARA